MTETQPGLFDHRPVPLVARKEVPQITWLEQLLLGAGCWLTAKDITLTTGGNALDRDIREIASGCTRIISGQRGYKHLQHATTEEVQRCSNWLVSQGKWMIRRGIAIQREAHRILG